LKHLLMFVLLVAFPLAAVASKPEARKPKKDAAAEKPLTEEEAAARAYEEKLNFRRGRVELPGGVAVLNVPEGFRYLSAEQSDKLLVEAWGNPPGMKTLGMLFPSDVSPVGEGGWGVVISYTEDGHVSDDDAGSVNYDDLLKEMKTETAAANKGREAQGYEAVTLVGWAAAPRYDAATHKLYWAKELSFAGAPAHTLNYDIRVLGRKGVLSFNAVSSMEHLAQVEAGMKEVLGFAEFVPGQRYADFNADTDHLAAYGIGALVAGKLAAKAGFFKLALGAILGAKKFVIVALIGLGALAAKLFRRKSE
jgi:uncharacterized membrane-anchored protein